MTNTTHPALVEGPLAELTDSDLVAAIRARAPWFQFAPNANGSGWEVWMERGRKRFARSFFTSLRGRVGLEKFAERIGNEIDPGEAAEWASDRRARGARY